MKSNLIYVAGPMRKGIMSDNVRTGTEVCDNLLDMGYLVINPFLSHFHDMIFPHDFKWWIEKDLRYIKQCRVLLRLSGESEGADMEVAFAIQNKIPVVYAIEELEADFPVILDVEGE